MPMLRSQKSEEEKPAKTMKTVAEQMQWVMVVPEKLTNDGDDDCLIYKLPHPQNGGVPNLFLFKNNAVYQLMKCEESFRSWFIDDSCQKDGSMFMVTPFDPLFLALPYIEKFDAKDKFSTLDNILVDNDYTDALTKLEGCLTKKNLLNICNCKESDDIIAYKSDESKILAWLSLKIQKLADHLSKTNINVTQGSKLNNFIQVNHNKKQNEDDCLRYAWSVISDYISAHWSGKLKENLNIKDAVKQVVKKQKLNDSTASDTTPSGNGSVEDYRDHSKPTKKTAQPKLTTAQKSLQKVDKKGMKTMTSFFTIKPKK